MLALMDEVKPHMGSIMQCLSTSLWILGALIAFTVNELTVVIKRDLKRNIQHTLGSRGCIVGVAPYHMMSSVSMWLYGRTNRGGIESYSMLSGPSYSLTPPIAYRIERGFDPQI